MMTRFSMFGLLALAACGDPATETTDGATLRWQLEGLEPLGTGFVYEAWAIVDGSPVSTGRFSVGTDGTASLDAFDLTADQVAGLEAYVLSIEPEQGDDPAPSAVKLLGGDFGADDTASLSIAHPAALGTDLTDATADFILETPSTGMIMDDFSLGIWFLDPAGPSASADLPTLPEGWVYEGWVVTSDGPISTGTFASGEGADSDAGGPAAGPDDTPPFPGQDFVEPELDLVGLTAVISVEPVPDDSTAPFVLKPLIDMTIEDVGGGVLQSMENNATNTNPTGMAWLETDSEG